MSAFISSKFLCPACGKPVPPSRYLKGDFFCSIKEKKLYRHVVGAHRLNYVEEMLKCAITKSGPGKKYPTSCYNPEQYPAETHAAMRAAQVPSGSVRMFHLGRANEPFLLIPFADMVEMKKETAKRKEEIEELKAKVRRLTTAARRKRAR